LGGFPYSGAGEKRMREYIIAYFVALVIMAAMDFTWFSIAADPIYQRSLGPILADKVNYAAAVAFYLIYALGVIIFAVKPGLDGGIWWTALLRGAMFGFFAYATYDLTNFATLKVWPLRVCLIDIAWGVFITGAVSGASAAAALALEK
jgi:uncharacterized membrane protein